jgi:hypothetical protein
VKIDATMVFSNYEAFSDMASGKISMDELQQQQRLTVHHRDPAFTAGLGRIFRSLLDRDESIFKSPRKLRRRSAGGESGTVIKSGWIYKKRDIIVGWRCRFFLVYPGRVEYFRDELDVIPRGVIPLLGADIKGPKKCTVNGDEEHWSLT